MTSRVKSLLAVGLAIPAAAFTFGGWAVTTIEDVPEYVVAGKPFTINYTVRQHGFGLMNGLAGRVQLKSSSSTFQKEVSAIGSGEGTYLANVVITQPGNWTVTVKNGFNPLGAGDVPLKAIAASAPAPAPMSAYDRGEQLYLAKGCVTCHTHALTKPVNSLKNGPDLSEPKFSSAYLARFLVNPSIKTDWKNSDIRMPNLGIKPAEASAIAAFLAQEKR